MYMQFIEKIRIDKRKYILEQVNVGWNIAQNRSFNFKVKFLVVLRILEFLFYHMQNYNKEALL